MPLSKLELKPGVNKEGTRYSTEGGWHDSDKVRFRKGLPEKIGGWVRLSNNVFNGISRSIHSWRTLASKLYVGVGTNTKFYIESGGEYSDITPLDQASATVKAATSSSTTVTLENNVGTVRTGMVMTGTDASGSAISVTVAAVASQGSITISASKSIAINAILHFQAAITLGADPLITGNTSTTLRIMDANGGYQNNDYVTLSGSVTTVNGVTEDDLLTTADSKEYQISTNQATVTATSSGASSDASPDFNTPSGTIEVGMTITGANIATVVYVLEVTGSYSQTNPRLSASVTISGADVEYTFAHTHSYTITMDSASGGTAAIGGGSGIIATYQINSGDEVQTPAQGWGAGYYGGGAWSTGLTTESNIRLWSQANFGEDLIMNYRGGPLFYWDGDGSLSTRATLLSSRVNSLSVPAKANRVLVSDISRFVFCLGSTAYLDTTNTIDPLLVRWSDQEDAGDWAPTTTNVAGSLRLSRGGEIITGIQARQEILVWTDAALYSLQLLGLEGWGAQIVGENVSICGPNAVAYANGIAFWMGKDKFYIYDGSVKSLPSTLHRHVFENFEVSQSQQVASGTNEEFNEVWWFYPSSESTTNDLYVVYNYVENLWYHGTMARTAWENSGIRSYPLAATYTKNLVDHEFGVDDSETTTTTPIVASITSSEFDLQDGHQFAFVWRMLPDITFQGSTQGSPSVDMTLNPLDSSGSGYNTPTSEGGSNTGTVVQGTTITVEPYTTHINTRLRGRQMSLKVESTDLGVKWQLGYPRIDMRPDGRR
jgi:hypothetical protein